MTQEKTDAHYEAKARELNAQTLSRANDEPRVLSATYADGRLTFAFGGAASEGAVAVVPARSLRALADATDAQLEAMQIAEGGASVHWPELDVQMSSVALLQVVFGLRTLQAHLAKAQSVRTAATAEAARRNGAKGGRPRKSQTLT